MSTRDPIGINTINVATTFSICLYGNKAAQFAVIDFRNFVHFYDEILTTASPNSIKVSL